jgi:hypothetical protein
MRLENIFIEMTVYAGTFLCGILASSMAMADCPSTMPVQLLSDCIMNENAGHSFPASDYVYMDLYQDWVKLQQPEQTNKLAKSEM